MRKLTLACFLAGLNVLAPGAETPNTKDARESNDANAAQPTNSLVPQPPPLAPRFKQVREKITTLFEHRNEPPPPPDPRANPFRPPGAPLVVTAPSTAPGAVALPVPPEPEPPTSDLSKLQECLTSLKFGGTLERGGHLYLMINGKPYTENEVVQAQVQGETVYLRVRQISRRSATIGLNEAEMMWNTGGPSK